jgi:restriction endonuclease S subunit
MSEEQIELIKLLKSMVTLSEKQAKKIAALEKRILKLEQK